MFDVSKQYINKRCGLHLAEYQKKDPVTGKLGIINGNGNFTASQSQTYYKLKNMK